jgi:dihydrofolate reductase
MVSLDGVMRAPGGPDEDPTGGFAFGGWTVSDWGEAMGSSMKGLDGKDRELALGRRTYEIFEAYWPYQPADDPIAQTLNAARRHVASRTLKTLDWKIVLGRRKRLFEPAARPAGCASPDRRSRSPGSW